MFQESAHAIFNLTVSPRRGGQHLRFQEVQLGGSIQTEEVEVTVESTEGAPYTVQQRVFQPLTNEFGNILPQDAFLVFSPTSSLGTLRNQVETPVMMGETLLYTSNSAGDSDAFVLVFNVRVPENQPGGVYHTQITFTAQPTDGSASPSIVTLDVRLEIRPTFHFTVQSARGGRELNLGRITKERAIAAEAVRVEIESNIGSVYRVVQQLTEPLISQEGEVLDESVFSFSAAGNGRGSLAAGGGSAPVLQSPLTIYTSSETGQGDAFEIQYALTPSTTQKAGVYTGSLNFRVESTSPFILPEVYNVPVRVEIEPILYLEVQVGQGMSGLQFGTLRPAEGEKQEQFAVLKIHSNLGKPYQVSQVVSRKLTNVEGAAIPDTYFTFYGAGPQSGRVVTSSPSPVKEGESLVFVSDDQGTPEELTLNYVLTLPRDVKSGSYTSEIRYSVTAL